MADKKISALTAATTPLAGTEVLPIVQAGSTVKVSVDNLTAGKAVSALSVTTPTVGAGSGSALSIQSNATTGATMDTSQNIGFGTTTINGYYGSGSVTTRGVFSYSSVSTDCNAAAKGLVVRNDDTTTSNLSMLAFGTLNTGNTPIATAAVWSVNDARTSGFSTGSLHFGTNGGSGVIYDRGNISVGGDFTLAVGNFVQGTAAKGVNFTANTGAAGMTSQLLNWYEEGTWTPTRNGFTEVLGAGSITTSGTYTRVGRMVTVIASIVPAGGATIAATSGIGSYLSGLPFSVATPCPGAWVDSSSVADNGGILANVTELYVTTAWVASGNVKRISATYFV